MEKKTAFDACTFQAPFWAVAIVGIWDVLFSAFCMGLFLKPLCKLLQSRDAVKLRYLAVKCTVLTATGVISTFIALTFLALGKEWYQANRVDDTINCLCLLLMSSSYKRPYEWLCAPCICCCQAPVNMIEKQVNKVGSPHADSVVASGTQEMTEYD